MSIDIGIRSFVHGKDGGVDELGPYALNMDVVAEELNRFFHGFSQDLGGRHNLWHPDQSERQGLRFMHQHICSMDRGLSPQWPQWSIERELVEMPLDQASRYCDPHNMPVVSLAPGHHPWEYQTPKALDMGTAYVERPVLDDVKKVGWAEVFWQLCSKLDFVDYRVLGKIFGVPMDWMNNIGHSPLNWTYLEAAKRGWAVKS